MEPSFGMRMLHLVTILLPVYLHQTNRGPGNGWAYEGERVEIDIQGGPISITGGDLTDIYIAEQLHFHWGKIDQRGSEHNIDGKYFPMEMHIVHYNRKYKSFSEALDKQDGLSVLAFLFEVGNHNDHIDHIIRHFSEIPYRDNHTMLEPFALRELLPKKLDKYCRYNGSLTTPPCYESVIWFIFFETIEISEDQDHARGAMRGHRMSVNVCVRYNCSTDRKF